MMAIRLLILLFLTGLSTFSCAQEPMQSWIENQIKAKLQEKKINTNLTDLQKEQVSQNGKGVDRQRESPSADPRSTSLVDQSSATDFFSIAANLIPVTPGLSQAISPTGSPLSDSNAAGSTTATASLYAILAALNRKTPTDPEFYKLHVDARRFFFTIGTAASKQVTDNTDAPAAVYGAKVLLINGRELYKGKKDDKKSNLGKIEEAQRVLGATAEVSVKLTQTIGFLIFKQFHPNDVNAQGQPLDPARYANFDKEQLATTDAWEHTLNSLNFDTKKQIDTLIEAELPTFDKERETLLKAYDDISKGMQMSLSYVANIRDSHGNNDHRAELIFDYGINSRINWTVNASGDYTDRKLTQNSAGGRFATSFQGDLTKSSAGNIRTPLRLTFSGEGKWLTKQKPQYTFETGLSIPLTLGVDIPLVYRFANRTAQINRKDSEARLGLSIDISHLVQAFK
jgi:hypothetical protein